ncbi:aldo/keto reductase [Devosia neptuniae]|uniref:aldo/keto reductase n=1 Tax=Devosia TaxID=46913 RepID=UPI0022AE6745|nr:aldo/keto reductase [Devosia neptuniae]MCZ4347690.1 aldo/keto reductase [Devosia neptuniae]
MTSNPIPRLGFGTYGRRGPEGVDAMLTALETGYRHLDTAQDYENETEVGQAVARSGLPRESIFVTTKIAPRHYPRGSLLPSLRESLDKLSLDQVDLTLLHWPSPNDEVPLAHYVEQLVEARSSGLSRLIGVSNFTIDLLEQTIAMLGKDAIANNQFELNPHMQNKRLADFCQSKGILVTCYLPIAHGTLGDDPILQDIARSHDATVAQIAIAFELAKGYAAIPTSGKPERIRENYAASKIVLTPQQIASIATRDQGKRRIDPEWGPKWD